MVSRTSCASFSLCFLLLLPLLATTKAQVTFRVTRKMLAHHIEATDHGNGASGHHKVVKDELASKEEGGSSSRRVPDGAGEERERKKEEASAGSRRGEISGAAKSTVGNCRQNNRSGKGLILMTLDCATPANNSTFSRERRRRRRRVMKARMAATLTAFSADYRSPKSHTPINN